jgi:hypothetical protein
VVWTLPYLLSFSLGAQGEKEKEGDEFNENNGDLTYDTNISSSG